MKQKPNYGFGLFVLVYYVVLCITLFTAAGLISGSVQIMLLLFAWSIILYLVMTVVRSIVAGAVEYDRAKRSQK